MVNRWKAMNESQEWMIQLLSDRLAAKVERINILEHEPDIIHSLVLSVLPTKVYIFLSLPMAL